MKTLTINEELKSLLPPLAPEEYTGLEQGILKDGILTPLVVWNNILVDGHHRYEICMKHEIPFTITNLVLDSLEDAKLWAWQHQTGRRNLTNFHRGELALKLKDVIAAKSKERQEKRNDLNKENIPATLPECKETRQELAKQADIGYRTLDKIEYIVEHGEEETKDKLRSGEKGTSINKEYNRLKKENNESLKAPEIKKGKMKEGETLDYTSPDKPFGPTTQLKPIPRSRPDILVGNLLAFFPKEFVPNMTRESFRMLHDRYGKDVTQPLVLELYEMYGK